MFLVGGLIGVAPPVRADDEVLATADRPLVLLLDFSALGIAGLGGPTGAVGARASYNWQARSLVRIPHRQDA